MEMPWAIPLVQAPIGPAATPQLVIEVCRTGALGTLAASWTGSDELRRQIREVAAGTARPFCVNLVLAFDQQARVELAIEERVPAISFSWGVDDDLIRQCRKAGMIVLVQVGSVRNAVRAQKAGAHLVQVQGLEAGGHVEGTRPLIEVLPEVRRAIDLPIVAAGGIANADERHRAIAVGADAVACGTAFLGAREADVHPRYLEALIQAESKDTVLTSLFDGGWPNAPHRVIRNQTVALWADAGQPGSGMRPGDGEVVAHCGGKPILRYDDAQPTNGTSGDVDSMAMYAGLGVGSVQESMSASAIIDRIIGNDRQPLQAE